MRESSVAAAANAAAVEEMDQKLKLSDQELELVNERLDEAQGKPYEKMCICQILTGQTVY